VAGGGVSVRRGHVIVGFHSEGDGGRRGRVGSWVHGGGRKREGNFDDWERDL